MGKKLNPTAIGAFVLGSIVIAVATVMILGGSTFFTKNYMFVSYFSDSINGLDVGAPVKFKGVTIGSVDKILLNMQDADMRDSTVTIVYSIDLKSASSRSGGSIDALPLLESVDKQIEEGLRAKLNYQSIVTGMLYIELDYFAAPHEPYKLQHTSPDYKEVPVIKSGLSEMGKTLEKVLNNILEIDFSQIANNANALLLNLNEKVVQIDAGTINRSVIKTLSDLDRVVNDPSIPAALDNIETLLAESREFLDSTGKEIKGLSASADSAIKQMDKVMFNINTIIAPQSPFRYELAVTLKNLSDTLLSVKNLTDYLERNPGALLRGKADEQQKETK